MQVSVGVIIPARNDASALGRAVESAVRQEHAEIDIIVIAVGPSEDDTLVVASRLAETYGSVLVVENPTGRTPQALNLAIAACQTDVIVRVDARSELPPRYVAHALESLSQTGAANVGAIQNPVGATTTERAIAAAMRSPFGAGGAAYRGANERKPVDTGYLGVFRRDALIAVGGYDEFFTRNQDAELNHRLNSAGHEVWLDPRLVVDYRPRPTLRLLAIQYWQYGWWRQLTVRKHPGSVRPRQLAAPVLVVAMLVCVVLAVLVSPVWLVPIGAYLLTLILVGAVTGQGSVGERLLMAMALATMHVAWGLAFIWSRVRSALGRAQAGR